MTDIVQLPLPNQITNGQLADADPLMDNLNYIAQQVNAFAQPAGSPLTEWIEAADAPSFISVTSFTLPGDYSAIIPVGRACKMVITAGAFVYGFPSTVTFDAGTNLTTFAFPSFIDGLLDTALSQVFYGILNSVHRSTPVETVLTASRVTSNQTLVAPSLSAVIFNGNTVQPGDTIDTLGEYNTTTGEWTCLRSGHFRIEIQLGVQLAAGAKLLQVFIKNNGLTIAKAIEYIVDTNQHMIHTAVNAAVVAGDVVTVLLTCNLTNVDILDDSDATSRLMIARLNGV